MTAINKPEAPAIRDLQGEEIDNVSGGAGTKTTGWTDPNPQPIQNPKSPGWVDPDPSPVR
jgi:hypothetical protein